MSDHTMETVMDRLGDLLVEFDLIVRAGFSRYREIHLDYRMEHSPRTRANCIYDHMMFDADSRIGRRDDVRLIKANCLEVWGVEDHTIIRLKKMNDDGSSRNYQTKQAKAFDRDEPVEGLFEEGVRLTIGYLQDATAENIKRVQVSRMQGRRVAWCAAIVPEADRATSQALWYEVTKQPGFLAA